MLRGWRRLRARLRYRHFDRDIRREIEVHRAMHEDALRRAGDDEDAARTGAARRLGNVTLAREAARGIWLSPWLESLWQDLAYAARSLRRQPGFTLPALAILFLAIGVNVGVFTFLAVFMRPWPVGDPSSIAELRPASMPGFSVAEYLHLRASARAVAQLTARDFQYAGIVVAPGAARDHGPIEFVSANYFSTMRLPISAGRDFRDDDDRAGAPPVAIISDGYWQRRFARDAAAIGRAITIDGQPFVIVGVAAAGFAGVSPGYRVELWVPLATRPAGRAHDARAKRPDDPRACCVQIAARLADDVRAEAAAAELDTLSRSFRAAAGVGGGGVTLRATGGLPGDLINVAALVAAILAAPLAVLALACANVGNLQLARNLRRRAEIAVRLSLGASRGRVVRQLLVEAGLIAAAAGGLGLLLAHLLPAALPVIIDLLDESDVFPFEQFVPDLRVVAFTAGVCAFSCLVFALAPALAITRRGAEAVAESRHGAGLGITRLRAMLMGGQVAVCMALLGVAGLLSRGIIEAARIDPGFSTTDVHVAQVTLPEGTTAARTRALVDGLADIAASTPVGTIGFAQFAPLSTQVHEARIVAPGASTSFAHANWTSTSYFGVLGVPLVAGRWADGEDEVVVNETFARTYWPDGSALGRTFRDRDRPYVVAGIVADTRQTRLDSVTPMYFASRRGSQTLVVRSSRTDLQARLTALARSVDADARVQVTPLTAIARRQLADAIELAAIAWLIGAIALLLAAIGIFGVFAFLVEERRREIGLRLALGARRGDILRALFAPVRRASIAGLVAGALLAAGAATLLRSQLYGVSPLDPLALGTVALVLVATAAMATFLPARRAAGIDPAITLKQ
jgi:predicted permease